MIKPYIASKSMTHIIKIGLYYHLYANDFTLLDPVLNPMFLNSSEAEMSILANDVYQAVANLNSIDVSTKLDLMSQLSIEARRLGIEKGADLNNIHSIFTDIFHSVLSSDSVQKFANQTMTNPLYLNRKLSVMDSLFKIKLLRNQGLPVSYDNTSPLAHTNLIINTKQKMTYFETLQYKNSLKSEDQLNFLKNGLNALNNKADKVPLLDNEKLMLSFSHARGFSKNNILADDLYSDIGGRKIFKIASIDFAKESKHQYIYINPLYKILQTDIDYLTNFSDVAKEVPLEYQQKYVIAGKIDDIYKEKVTSCIETIVKNILPICTGIDCIDIDTDLPVQDIRNVCKKTFKQLDTIKNKIQ